MPNDPEWLYNEFQQVGTDYCDQEEVDDYDARHSKFRDMDAEANAVLDKLELGKDQVLVDLGCGTGTMAVQAAKRCGMVHAVDVSLPMLHRARTKAEKAGVSNIKFHHGGFLTHEHKGQAADVITTTFVFHHLPDFWKGVALKRMHAMLRPGGLLYMHDVIMEEQRAMENIQALIDQLGQLGGDSLRKDTEKHFKEEFSTYDWVMDELFARAGFVIKTKEMQSGVLGTYICERS